MLVTAQSQKWLHQIFFKKDGFILSSNYGAKFTLNLDAKFHTHTFKSGKVSHMNRENEFAKFTFWVSSLKTTFNKFCEC